jgi:CubicO group peptidase (beta-lactamase class C family)
MDQERNETRIIEYSTTMKVVMCLLLFPLLGYSQKIDSSIAKIMLAAQQEGFSGVVLAADKGRPVYFESFGYRDFAKKTPLQKDDIFELASVSKQFTAAVIMMLQQEGRLRFDDPVEQYLTLPYKGITIRQLLTHTSGLPDYQAIMDKYWDKSQVASNKEILEYLNRYAPPALFAPGEKYEYSNTGYVLLASIAEKASGRDFIEFCQTRIFQPLGMTSTAIRSLQQKAATPNFALGHIYVADKGRYIRADSFPSSDYTIWLGNRKGPGRISSTAEDLLKWDHALYGESIIGAKSRREAFRPARLNNGQKSYYGFGWELTGDKKRRGVVQHTGDNPGYSTKIVRFTRDNRTLIVLCNNAFRGYTTLLSALETLMLNDDLFIKN